jgi:carbohydrate kinase (thermoresistant glucokinase family)
VSASIDPRLNVIVMGGVAGSGKSTVGAALARRFGWVYAEADEFHPASNIEKMSAGIPLTDEDRAPWLEKIAAYISDICARNEHAVVSCSALKRAYRKTLIGAHSAQAQVVLLNGGESQIAARLQSRHGHFMPATLLKSQIATLELPSDPADAIVVPVGGTIGDVVDRVVAALAR